MRPSPPLYDALAGDYDGHFAAPHRRAYDDLAWEICAALVGPAPATVVDVGCGVGRWASRLVAAGHRVIGIEPALAMAAVARDRLAGSDFTLLPVGVEDAVLTPAERDPPPAAGSGGGVLPAGGADVVLAMGSLQYSADPAAAIARCAGWVRPGGAVCVLVDSRPALVLELLAADRPDEALERLATKRGRWQLGEHAADLHLLDAAELTAAVRAAGLEVERLAGLLVGASAYGRQRLVQRLTDDYEGTLAGERRLAAEPALADLGKQLLIVGRRPAR
jgi:SAM-dependent methyltransferase